jgi:hypothetical protein
MRSFHELDIALQSSLSRLAFARTFLEGMAKPFLSSSETLGSTGEILAPVLRSDSRGAVPMNSLKFEMECDVGGVVRLLEPAVVEAMVDDTEDEEEEVDGESTPFVGTLMIPLAAKACAIFCCPKGNFSSRELPSPLGTLTILVPELPLYNEPIRDICI